MGERRLAARSAAAGALAALALCAYAQDPPADFEAQAKAFRERIAALDAVDPMQPQSLSERVEFARLLHGASRQDCRPELAAAEQVLAPVLAAPASATIAWPDGPGDALALLQTIQNTQGDCAGDDASSRAAFESAIRTGTRAVEVLRDNWDFEEMAIAQFNIAFARYQLGDVDGALHDLEQVLAWDQEFGFREELENDYATWLRWRDGKDPDPDEVDRFVTSFNQTKARFQFAWKPHRSQWSTEAWRANLRNGAYSEATVRYQTTVDVTREGDDWVVTTILAAAPTIQAPEPAGAVSVPERMQALIGGLTSALPEMVIARDGTFKSLRNLEQHRANLLREVKRAVAEGARGAAGPAAADAERAVETFLSPELLTTLAAAQWDIAVAAWIDGELDHGDWYTATFAEPLPGVTDKPVSKTMEFKVSRWLPCAPARAPQCVEVLVKITPDDKAMSEAIVDFVSRLMPAASQADMRQALLNVDFKFDVRYRLVTEPDTLRPWAIEERKYLYASSLEKGKRSVQARHERTVETGSYPE